MAVLISNAGGALVFPPLYGYYVHLNILGSSNSTLDSLFYYVLKIHAFVNIFWPLELILRTGPLEALLIGNAGGALVLFKK